MLKRRERSRPGVRSGYAGRVPPNFLGTRPSLPTRAGAGRARVARREGTYVAPARQTLGESLVSDWLPAVRRELADSTWESYERNIRHHVAPALGGVQLQALDGSMLNKLYANQQSGRECRYKVDCIVGESATPLQGGAKQTVEKHSECSGCRHDEGASKIDQARDHRFKGHQRRCPDS